MLGKIKIDGGKFFIIHEGSVIPIEPVTDTITERAQDGMEVEFHVVRNPNYSWHNNEPQFFAKITTKPEQDVQSVSYWRKRCLAAEKYISDTETYITDNENIESYIKWQILKIKTDSND
jgi:hypothetical protein